MDQPAGTVLVVEDDADTRNLLTSALTIEGFHAVAAEDGLEGLHLLRAVHHRAPDVPCLILLDLTMPRLSGEEFRRAQLADPRVAAVPVVVMSGAVDLETRARDLGAVAIVPKPVDDEILLEIVRRYCSSEADSAYRRTAWRTADARTAPSAAAAATNAVGACSLMRIATTPPISAPTLTVEMPSVTPATIDRRGHRWCSVRAPRHRGQVAT